jgi:hypothetical protein
MHELAQLGERTFDRGHVHFPIPSRRPPSAYSAQTPGDSRGQRRTFFHRRRVCKFSADRVDYISYKDASLIMPGGLSQGPARE